MRIPSGKTDQYIYFVAYDSTDHSTRLTGLSSFTVRRSRNGATEAGYTTPTVVELSSGNMPGVYALLIDEDTTIASTSQSEEMVLHITKAGMDPITRIIELYRSWTNLDKSSAVIGRGTCTTGGSTTSVVTSAFVPNGAVADQFKNRIIIFDADTTTAALRGQAASISASSNAAAPTFTVSALTTAPVSGDTFSVV